MKEVKNKYGLRQKSTGQLVGYCTSSNADGDCCVEEQYILQPGSDQLWLVDDPEQAEYVRLNSTEWYNAGFDTPTNNLDSDDLEVVEVNVEVKVEPVEVSLPTPYEFFEARYAKKEPRHWEYLKGEIEKCAGTSQEIRYGWHDILMARHEGG